MNFKVTVCSCFTYRPVVVQVAHLICETLHMVRLESIFIINHIVIRGVDSPLAGKLANQEEVVPVGQG